MLGGLISFVMSLTGDGSQRSCADMVGAAIVALKDRTGSSNMAIEKFILANYPKVNFKRTYLRGAIKRGVESGFIAVHHNHKNSYKMGKVVKKAPAKKKSAAAAEKKAAAAKEAVAEDEDLMSARGSL